MYLSETDVYKRFFEAVKKEIKRLDEEADAYGLFSELKGMVTMTEALMEEEKE